MEDVPFGTVVGVCCRSCGEVWDLDDEVACLCVPPTWRARRWLKRNWLPVRQGSLNQFVGNNATCVCGADLGMAEVPADISVAVMEHLRECPVLRGEV